MPAKEHRAPWGRSLILISVLSSLLCLGISTGFALSRHSGLRWPLLLPLVVLAVCALFTVRGYVVTADALLVRRLLWTTRLPWAGAAALQSVHAEPDAMRGSMRLWGNGGLYAFTGLFRSKKLGRYRAFVMDRHRTVVLRLAGRTIVVSPASPQDFVRDVRQVSGLADSG
ncbi:PH domain-containing protein [Comamonas terrae]|uniref:PH domain-containing protein n=1 Tax=Comamonas terrae TaxID=673548 RepID=A0ABW5UKI6_9BURK|nr:PH domain-containing protein [Comamonas terrae]